MINMRDGRGGFVGGFKTLIRGAFSFQYSKTSANAPGDIIGWRGGANTYSGSPSAILITGKQNKILISGS